MVNEKKPRLLLVFEMLQKTEEVILKLSGVNMVKR